MTDIPYVTAILKIRLINLATENRELIRRTFDVLYSYRVAVLSQFVNVYVRVKADISNVARFWRIYFTKQTDLC